MKCLHIFSSDSNDKFSKPFIEFINNNFDNTQHDFFLTSGKKFKPSKLENSNASMLPYNISSTWKLLRQFKKYDKVFLHGLSGNKYINLALVISLSVLPKSYWCIWGGDLYSYELTNTKLKSKIGSFMRKKIIKNMGYLITHVKGDFDLAKKWYSAKGQYLYSFMYLSNTFDLNMSKYSENEQGKKNKYILIGNSGLQTNNHLEIFEKLKSYRNSAIIVICPLSYAYESNPDYKNEVINKGKELFGDKFMPITEFMPFDKYLEILSKVDIAIFNHKRQQALGNIITLIGLGKKVYIRDDITTWNFCLDHDLKVYSTNSDLTYFFEEIDDEMKQKNIENVKIRFSKEKLLEDLKKIFNEEIKI